MNEIWKDVQGFEGLYQISNKGNVRSLPRVCADHNGRQVKYHGNLLKPQANSRGYLRVQLKKSGKHECRFVHRLVAEQFVDNPKSGEYTIVNHLDNNFRNNDSSNLEWTTYSGNTQHAKMQGRLARTKEWLSNQRNALKKYDKPVIGFDPLTGKIFVSFDSIQEAGRNGYEASSVCNCCKGIRKTHKGLAWMYASKEGVTE